MRLGPTHPRVRARIAEYEEALRHEHEVVLSLTSQLADAATQISILEGAGDQFIPVLEQAIGFIMDRAMCHRDYDLLRELQHAQEAYQRARERRLP